MKLGLYFVKEEWSEIHHSDMSRPKNLVDEIKYRTQIQTPRDPVGKTLRT